MKIKSIGRIAVAVALGTMLAACHDDSEQLDSRMTTRAGAAAGDSVEEVPVLPKKEMRAVWVATVYGIDWPQTNYSSYMQKRMYTRYLDSLKAMNINTVFFQVRSMADAFYNSPYEPWSKYITGTAGKNPGYDVLKFLIDEAHKRCISFHAWINPYRIAMRSSENVAFPTLDSRIPTSIVKDYKKIRVFNPALPETRAWLDSVVKDLIVKYDVNGLHMDDYFYPSASNAGESDLHDSEEFAKYGAGYSNIDDWRRENVNLMVQSLQKLIRETRKEVVFSISPQGNVENDYNGQRADVAKWMLKGWLDLMIPQIYYVTGTASTNFNARLDWWASHAYRCALGVGYGIYRFDPNSTTAKWQTNAMLQEQFDLADKKSKVTCSVLYNTNTLMANNCDIQSVIRKRFAQKALVPFYGKYTAVKPAAPTNVQIINDNTLSWDAGKNVYYAIYRSNGNRKVATLMDVTRQTTWKIKEEGKYFVTAVNSSDNAESPISALVKYPKSEEPNGITPIRIDKNKK